MYTKVQVSSIILTSLVILKFFFISELTEILKICWHMRFFRSCFQPWFHSDTFCAFLFFYFLFTLSNKYCLLKLVLLNFCLQKTSFLLQTHFFGWLERHAMYLDPKVKTFHDSMFLATPLRNCLFFMKYCRKEKFHSVFLLLILRHLNSRLCEWESMASSAHWLVQRRIY